MAFPCNIKLNYEGGFPCTQHIRICAHVDVFLILERQLNGRQIILCTTHIKDLQSLVENYVQKTATKINHGSFDHLDMQSLNNYRFFFSFCNCTFKHFTACNTPLKKHF